jgi:hypothetical protein
MQEFFYKLDNIFVETLLQLQQLRRNLWTKYGDISGAGFYLSTFFQNQPLREIVTQREAK